MSDAAPAALEIVTVGDELLLGETVDGNSAWLGRRLAGAGIRVVRRATVGDDRDAIAAAVREALERTGTVVCTGGLGPTRDDLTRPAVAGLFGRALRVDEAVLEAIRDRFRRAGRDMPEVNRVQAEVPDGAVVLPNSRGTAPGLALEDDAGRAAVLLPGVPAEMRAITDEHLLGWLSARFPGRGRPILHRVVRTTGLPESELAERVDDLLDDLAPLAVAFLPDPVGVDLRVTSWGALEEGEARRLLDCAERRLSERLGRWVYATGAEDLVDAVVALLRRRALRLAVAESCTGGLLAKRITDRAGVSDVFLAGVVSYSNDAKRRLLGVAEGALREHGAVSEPVVRQMAEGAARAGGAECAVAITGVAGPTGGTPEKPVGTVWVAALAEGRVEARLHRFPGDRAEIRDRSAQAALALLWEMLREGR